MSCSDVLMNGFHAKNIKVNVEHKTGVCEGQNKCLVGKR